MSNLPLDYNSYNTGYLNPKFNIDDTKNIALSNQLSNDFFKSFYVGSDYNIHNFNDLLNETKNILPIPSILTENKENIPFNNRLDQTFHYNEKKINKKPKMDSVTHFYLTSISIVALFIVYRMIQKSGNQRFL